MTQEPCILVIGAPRMALSLFCDRLPQAGETVSLKEHPLYEMGDRATALAVALTRLHARTVFCGVVGDDNMGRIMRDRLYAEGVDTRFLYTAPHTATGLECRLCGKADEARGLQFAGVGRLLEKEQAEEAFACLPDAVCLLADLPPEILSHVMLLASSRHIPVIMDARGGETRLADLPQAEIFCANADECEALSGERPGTADQCLRAMLSLSGRIKARHHVLKLEDRGCFFLDGRLPRYLSACVVHPGGGTGAGTVFLAALTVLYLKSDGNLPLSCKYANASAALALTNPGLYLPTQEEIADFLRQS